jgi:arylformamidase
MITTLHIGTQTYTADLRQPLDISIPLSPDGPRAWYVDRMIIRPVEGDGFVGSVSEGGSVNFRNIHFNPHGHGTHTESYEHVANVKRPIGNLLSRYFFSAQLITITPEIKQEDDETGEQNDLVITAKQLHELLHEGIESLVVRTFPNGTDKQSKNYSDTNFCYFTEEALAFLAEKKIQHLLVDLPSVDREHDAGRLAAHKAFWKHGDESRHQCTISEFIYVADSIQDGLFLLEMQIAPFVNDAAPSRPVLYALNG